MNNYFWSKEEFSILLTFLASHNVNTYLVEINQAESSCSSLRISWILMEGPCFCQNCLGPQKPQILTDLLMRPWKPQANDLKKSCLMKFCRRNNLRYLDWYWYINLKLKGQSISKCFLGVIVWTKRPMTFFPGFLP